MQDAVGSSHGLRSAARLRLLLTLALATLGFFTRTLFSSTTCFFRSLLSRLLFFSTTKVLGLNTLALAALVLDTLRLAAHGLFGLATLGVDLVLLLTSLLFEHIALDVGLLLANFDVHRTSTTLRAGQLELALRLALERDLAGRSIAVVATAVAATQMSQQFELRIIADAIVGSVHFDACLIELHEQPIDRHLQDFGKLGNCYFCHRLFNPPCLTGPLRTSGHAPS